MTTGTRLSNLVAPLTQDIRLALRRMRRAPALAVAIVLTLALGLGGAAAIFSVSRAAFLNRLPYANPDELVLIRELRAGTGEQSPTSLPTLMDWRSLSGFRGIEAYDPANFTVGAEGGARMSRGARVTAGFFGLLGVAMTSGRDFVAGEFASDMAIVTDRFARSVGSGAVVGQPITINGTQHVIAGVLPSTFHFALLQDAEVFVPLPVDAQQFAARTERSLHAVGRLRTGTSLAGAADQIGTAMADLARIHAAALEGRTAQVTPLRNAFLGNVRPILTTLLVAVALLLGIMGANLALLALSRYLDRAPELVMQRNLGATRARILRPLLIESLVPGVVGAAFAVVIGGQITERLISAIPQGVRISMPYLMEARLDPAMIAGIGILAVALVTILGLAPATFIREGAAPNGVRATLSRRDRQLRRSLVAGQVAIATVLLVAAGLLTISLGNVVRRELGFRDPAALVAARLPLSGQRYQDPAAQRQFYEALLVRSAALPGVRGAGLVDEAPGGGGGATNYETVDRPVLPASRPRVGLRTVGGEYFGTMGIPVVNGRPFDASDRHDSAPVAVVSTSFARLLAADGSAIGRRIRLGSTGSREWEVVGIAGDVQVTALDAESPPVVYLPMQQAAENRMMLVLRTNVSAPSIAGQLRLLVRELDSGVPVYGVARLEDLLGASRAVFSRRLPMILCGVFAVAALALTVIAVYAVSLHEAWARRREFGIRAALGATPGVIRRLILADAVLVSVAGVGVGVLGGIALSRVMSALLYGVGADDLRVYLAASGIMLAMVLMASLAPAWRAGSMNPSIVMRAD